MKNDKDIEKLKVYVELLKSWIDIFKILMLTLMTVGAGIGAVAYKEYGTSSLNKVFLTILSSIGIVILLFALRYWLKIRQLEKEIEKWKP